MAIPGLPMGNRARVYKQIVEWMQTDPVLLTVVKVWTTGLGTGEWKSPKAQTATHILISPRLGPVEPYSPDSQLGNLQIEVRLGVVGAAVGSLDMLDVMNLWEAIENAFYPFGDQARQWDVEQRLRDAGSHTGQIKFSQPATFQGVDPDTKRPILAGMMQLDVIRPLAT